MSKVRVPEEMVVASLEQLRKKWGYDADISMDSHLYITRTTIEAALEWMSENPIVPTNEQMQEVWNAIGGIPNFHKQQIIAAIVEWQRQMFITAKDEPALKDLLYEANPFPNRGAKYRHDEAVKEAYRRGKEAGSK